MNNIFLFDIDGTLSSNGLIPQSAIDIIKEIRKNKDYVLLSTGRCKGQLKDILSIIEVDGLIQNNGAYATLNNQVFFKEEIDKKAIKRLLDNHAVISLLTKDEYIRLSDDPLYFIFTDYFKIEAPKLSSLSILDEDIYSLGVYDYNPDSFNTILYPELDFVKVNPYGFDVIPKGVNKGHAVQKLKELYKDKRIIAFGDNYNDYEMLYYADVAIAMPKSPKDLKNIASFVTKDVFEDGIAYAIKEYLKYEN